MYRRPVRAVGRIARWVIALVVVIVVLSVGSLLVSRFETDRAQDALESFYTPPDPLPSNPGTVIRTEPLGVDVPGAEALRMLYVSQRPDGTPAASGAMLFIPNAPAPSAGRPVVAWAHGTVGMGNACAPSRSSNPLADTANWLDQMLELGYVVVATDYIGLGTPGDELYLVNEAEVRDVVNSVRAVRNIQAASASNRYAVWGHSQGGHTSLWTGHLGEKLAPELDLVGVAAAAPAAELVDIMSAQWNTLIGWGIGPEVMVSWPVMDSSLDPASIMTGAGASSYERLAQECTSDRSLSLELIARTAAREDFFSSNPVDAPGWRDYAQAQTPPPMPADIPVFIAQGTADQVVLAWPNARLIDSWCAEGSTIASLWMGGVDHIPAATTAGPEAVRWIADRFAGDTAPRTCTVPPPISPEPPTDTN